MNGLFKRKKLTISKAPSRRSQRVHELFRFADKFDIILLFIGFLAALVIAVIFPLMLQVYQKIANIMIDYTKIHSIRTQNGGNFSNSSLFQQGSSGCIHILNMNVRLHAEIVAVLKWYLLLGFLNIFFYWLCFSCWLTSAERQIRRIRFLLFRHILHQNIGWFDQQSTGSFSNQLIEDLDKMKEGMSDKMIEFISSVTKAVGCLVFSLIKGWKLTLVFISIAPLIIIAFNITIKSIVKFATKEAKVCADTNTIVHEVLGAIRTVTAFGGQKNEENRYENGLNKVYKMGIRKGVIIGLCQAVTNTTVGIIFALAAWYGPYLLRSECTAYSAGNLIVIFMASLTSIMCVATLIPNIEYIAEATGTADVIIQLLEQKSTIDSASNTGQTLNTFVGSIEFKHVQFQFPTRNIEIFKDLNFKIAAGQTVAVVGDTGCGKSTIVQLILRFYNTKSGQILIDNHPIESLNLAWLRSKIGTVNQEPVLFPISIEDNIRLGKADATLEEIIQACQMANIHEFIMNKLDQNYNTIVDEKLSGGERQRLAIARALIANPKILLLDEATSALDNTSERIVQQALNQAKLGRTTIIIAHRLSTIRNADLIFTMKQNLGIVEIGTHNQLMDNKNHYFELVKAQELTLHTEIPTEHEPNNNNNNLRTTSSSSSIHIDELQLMEDINKQSIDKQKTIRRYFCNHRSLVIRLLNFNRPEWIYIVIGIIAAMLVGATEPVVGIVFSSVYHQYANTDLENQTRQTRNLALIIFFLHLIDGVFIWTMIWAFAVSGERLTKRMRLMCFSAILRQEIGFFDMGQNSVSALTTRLSADASALKGLSGIRIGVTLQAFGSLLTAIIISFQAGWKLSFVMFCFAPLMVLSGLLQGQSQSKSGKTKSANNWADQGAQCAAEVFNKIRTVVTLGCEDYFIEKFENAFNNNFSAILSKIHLRAIGYGISNSLIFFLHITTFTYGSKLVENGEMNVDQVFRIFIVITFAVTAVGQSLSMMPQYSKARTAAIRIFSLIKRQSSIDPSISMNKGIILPADQIKGKIEFKNVYFSYPMRQKKLVLRDCSYTCLPHTSSALVGKSGYGKSTAISLLLRYYDPQKGSILLDGHDLRDYNLQWLRSIISVVQQEPILFNLSIRDNIAYGQLERKVTDEEIYHVSKLANIHDVIVNMPKGYETICGSKGSQLSGGERQRVAIARALLRKPILFLCDEATSALDNISEKFVQQALDNVQKSVPNQTSLTIAHRLTTIQHCDQIFVFNRGRMSEQGSHESLLEQKHDYYHLWMNTEKSQ
ncbi:hypothetical protein I4U23_016143 [Adineta vaga]|nr:hypothetical protein I4U23_016143 [Adineta vaga]